jgi:hypothetical protein
MKKETIFILILSLIKYNVIILCVKAQNLIGSHDQGGHTIARNNLRLFIQAGG